MSCSFSKQAAYSLYGEMHLGRLVKAYKDLFHSC